MFAVNRTAALALSMSVVVASGVTALAAGPASAGTSPTTSIAMSVPGTGVDITDQVDENGDVQEQSAGTDTDSPEVTVSSTPSGSVTTPETVDPSEAPPTATNTNEDSQGVDHRGQGDDPQPAPSALPTSVPSTGQGSDDGQSETEPSEGSEPSSDPSQTPGTSKVSGHDGSGDHTGSGDQSGSRNGSGN